VRVSSSLSADEIRAAAETHNELGPAYRDAVVDSFLDKAGREIDARVDARLARQQAAPPSARYRRGSSGSPMALAITSIALGIPISAIAVAAGMHPAGLLGLLVVWMAIAVINVAYNAGYSARLRQPPGHG
jgi:F0F1-type ATP synthase assembly protein I